VWWADNIHSSTNNVNSSTIWRPSKSCHVRENERTELTNRLLGGSSKVDILIATPGRLMDHLSTTPNFTLQHLRFLIIDEADRLLNQSFQNWLSKVLSHLRPPTTGLPEGFERKPWDRVANAWLEAYGLVKPVRGLSKADKPSVSSLDQRLVTTQLICSSVKSCSSPLPSLEIPRRSQLSTYINQNTTLSNHQLYPKLQRL
jgi:hypothetical protein